MKKILWLILLCVFLADSSYADLTKQDIEEIRKIVKEEIQGEVRHVNQRIDDLKQEINTRIDAVNTRIDDVNTRINDVNTRINDLQGLLYVILAGMFTLVGFVIWDRRTTLAPAVRRVNDLEEKELLLEKAIKEFAWKEPRLAEALKSVGLL